MFLSLAWNRACVLCMRPVRRVPTVSCSCYNDTICTSFQFDDNSKIIPFSCYSLLSPIVCGFWLLLISLKIIFHNGSVKFFPTQPPQNFLFFAAINELNIAQTHQFTLVRERWRYDDFFTLYDIVSYFYNVLATKQSDCMK